MAEHRVDPRELQEIATELASAAAEIEKALSRLQSKIKSARWAGTSRTGFERELDATINILRMQAVVLKQKHAQTVYSVRSAAEKLGY